MAEKMILTEDCGVGNSKYDELMRQIFTAKEELFKKEIEANTVILNGQKYSVMVKDGYRPSIFGMAVETEFLPVEWDFIVQQKIEPQQPPTNADRIRAMSDEELAEWLATAIAKHYDVEAVVPNVESVLWLGWLKQEATMAKYDPDEFFSAERSGKEWAITVKIDPADVVERALDEITYKEKTLREWADLLINPKSNADRIRAMSDEELAKAFAMQCCGRVCKGIPFGGENECVACWLGWLRQEADND